MGGGYLQVHGQVDNSPMAMKCHRRKCLSLPEQPLTGFIHSLRKWWGLLGSLMGQSLQVITVDVSSCMRAWPCHSWKIDTALQHCTLSPLMLSEPCKGDTDVHLGMDIEGTFGLLLPLLLMPHKPDSPKPLSLSCHTSDTS